MQQTLATIAGVNEEGTQIERRLMQRAISLAAQGVGQVSPGPLVGCVIAQGAEILGEGFYVYEQLKHAETYALEQAGIRAKGATAYVSLEPHAHHGRTPPCTDALIAAGVTRVVAPTEDPNPRVSGKGFEHLRSAGIEVSVGVLAAEAERLNEKYFHFMRTGRPFVHLKLATSLDGKIATRTGDSRWITGIEARARVHELRHEHDAILVGAGTAATDDPLLTDRSGRKRRRRLVRVVLDEQLTMSAQSRLATTANDEPVLVFSGKPAATSALGELMTLGIEVSQNVSSHNAEAVLDALGRRQIQSVLIEGGARVAGRFLDAGLVNKVSFFLAPTIIGGGDAPSAIAGEGAEQLADAWDLQEVEIHHRGRDVEVTGYPKRLIKAPASTGGPD